MFITFLTHPCNILLRAVHAHRFVLALLLSVAFPSVPFAEEESVSAVEPPEIRNPVRLELQRTRALAESFDGPGSLKWLNAGEDEFLAIYTIAARAVPWGVILLMPDNISTPDNRGLIRHLRIQLAEHGWSTVAFAAPDYRVGSEYPERPPAPQQALVEGEAPADPSQADMAKPMERHPLIPQSEVEPAPEKVAEMTGLRINAVQEYVASETPAPMLMIAIGLSASWSAEAISRSASPDIIAMSVITPKQPEDLSVDFNERITDIRLPILEILLEKDKSRGPSQRIQLAKRKRHIDYQQQRIIAHDDFRHAEELVLRRIRGWLKARFEEESK